MSIWAGSCKHRMWSSEWEIACAFSEIGQSPPVLTPFNWRALSVVESTSNHGSVIRFNFSSQWWLENISFTFVCHKLMYFFTQTLSLSLFPMCILGFMFACMQMNRVRGRHEPNKMHSFIIHLIIPSSKNLWPFKDVNTPRHNYKVHHRTQMIVLQQSTENINDLVEKLLLPKIEYLLFECSQRTIQVPLDSTVKIERCLHRPNRSCTAMINAKSHLVILS